MIKIPIGLKNLDLKNIDFRDTNFQAIILIILVSLIASILYLYFVFFAQIGRVASLAGKTFKTRGELYSTKSLILQKEIIKKRLEEYNEKVELYEKKLPAEQEIPSLLENLSNMAKAANVKIVGIMPALSYFKGQKEDKGRIYQEIPILITAKSGYHELGYFLSSLENADRYMKVVDISVKANKASPKKHDLELMICTYILFPENS